MVLNIESGENEVQSKKSFCIRCQINETISVLKKHDRLDKTVEQNKDDGLVNPAGDAGGGGDGVGKLEAEGEDGGEEEGGDEDLGGKPASKMQQLRH